MSSTFIRSRTDFERLVTLGTTTESLTVEFKADYGDRHIPSRNDPGGKSSTLHFLGATREPARAVKSGESAEQVASARAGC